MSGCWRDNPISCSLSCRPLTAGTIIPPRTTGKSHNIKGNSGMRSHHAVIAAFICLFGLSIAVAQQPGRTPSQIPTQPTTQSEETSPQQTTPQAQRPPERLSRTQLPREQQPQLEPPESTERAQ